MQSEEIFAVLMKLNGEVRPTGDSSFDRERLDNMHRFTEVFTQMYCVLEDIATRYKDSDYHSEKVIGQIAARQLDDLGIPR